jgi:predicted Rossmann fold nucleotide-binding protein DprA/Smf involved in DNA uptake
MKSQSGLEIHHLRPNNPYYPVNLSRNRSNHAPQVINAAGDLAILGRNPLALFCSVKCPGNLILQTYDLAQKWRDAGVTVISGFHSPMERECLNILLRSPHPVIVCPARGIPKRIPPDWKRPLEEGRLLLLSAFPATVRRATVETAHQRSRFVAALANAIFVAYAEPNSKTEFFCREIIAWGKPLYTLASDANQTLIAFGAKPFTADALASCKATPSVL